MAEAPFDPWRNVNSDANSLYASTVSETFNSMVQRFQKGMKLDAAKTEDGSGPSNPPAAETPFLICRNQALVKVRNALGIVGVMLCCDDSIRRFRMSGFLTLFSLMDGGELATSKLDLFRSYGYEPQPVEVNSLQSVYDKVVFSDFKTDLAFRRLLNTFVTFPSSACLRIKGEFHEKLRKIHTINYFFEHTIAFCGMYYLFPLKQFKKGKLQDILSPMWSVFAHNLGVLQLFPSLFLIPSEKASRLFQRNFHAMFGIRKELFLAIRVTYYKSIRGWSIMCGHLLNFLQYTELHTLRLINRYIFFDNPDLVAHPVFEPEIETLCSSLRYLQEQRIEIADLPYLKLLYNSSVTDCLGTNRYKNLTYLADKIHFGRVMEKENDWDHSENNIKNMLDRLAEHAIKRNTEQLGRSVRRTSHPKLAPYRDFFNILADPFTTGT